VQIKTLPAIETVPIEAIRPYWRNPRKNEAAIPAVKASIERYGLNQPLVVDAKGVIVVGHTRYRALVELGVKEVPVVRPKLTRRQASEYRVADNASGEIATWDRDSLIPELREFESAGDMQVFFPSEDLTSLLRDTAGTGASYTPVTSEQMDRVIDRQQSAMADLTRPKLDAQIKLACPGCGDEFFVDRATLDTHPGES
jgi:hypothetical protein